MGQLPASVFILPKWLTPTRLEVPQEVDMEATLSHLAPGHPRLAAETSRPERVSVPLAYLSPLSLVHLLMVAPFLSPSNMWHMMHAKADEMGINQRVILFTAWMRATTVET